MELKEIKHVHMPAIDIGRYSNGQLLIALTMFLIGFLIVTQIKGQATISNQLTEQTEGDLGSIIREVTFETESLQRDVSESTVQLLKYNQTAQNTTAVFETSEENLQKLRIFIGQTNVHGPGVIITIKDENQMLTSYDLLDLVQELKAAGSEAISIDGNRVVNRTSFGQLKGDVTINGIRIFPPYEVKAISDPKTLSGAVTLLGGIRDTFSSFEGVTITIREQDDITIKERPQIPSFVYAKQYESKDN